MFKIKFSSPEVHHVFKKYRLPHSKVINTQITCVSQNSSFSLFSLDALAEEASNDDRKINSVEKRGNFFMGGPHM